MGHVPKSGTLTGTQKNKLPEIFYKKKGVSAKLHNYALGHWDTKSKIYSW